MAAFANKPIKPLVLYNDGKFYTNYETTDFSKELKGLK
jgi:hypothetical protein